MVRVELGLERDRRRVGEGVLEPAQLGHPKVGHTKVTNLALALERHHLAPRLMSCTLGGADRVQHVQVEVLDA